MGSLQDVQEDDRYHAKRLFFLRLPADPEERFTSGGQKVTTLRVATNSRRGGKDETIWWRVTLWGDRFEKMMPYVKKGSALIIVGEMAKPQIYNDKEGKPQASLEMTAEVIRFSPFGKGGANDDQAKSFENKAPAQSSNETMSAPAPSLDDEIPF